MPPPVPPPGSGQTLASQYRVFTKRRLELGAPSPAWLIAVPLIQVSLSARVNISPFVQN